MLKLTAQLAAHDQRYRVGLNFNAARCRCRRCRSLAWVVRRHMNRGGSIIEHLMRLLAVLSVHCQDRSTLDALSRIAGDRERWPEAHDLFQRIREKTLDAEQRSDASLSAQYLFEEICAKTLYNLSHSPAPFDSDSPYWIVPSALALARALEIDRELVLQAIDL